MTQNKFNVGDTVRVFGNGSARVGTVSDPAPNPKYYAVEVRFSSGEKALYYIPNVELVSELERLSWTNMTKKRLQSHVLEDGTSVYIWREAIPFARARCYAISSTKSEDSVFGHVEWRSSGVWAAWLNDDGSEVWEELTGKQWATRSKAIEALAKKHYNTRVDDG